MLKITFLKLNKFQDPRYIKIEIILFNLFFLFHFINGLIGFQNNYDNHCKLYF